jgi:L-glutamine synthetase (EC 6.3.1.2)
MAFCAPTTNSYKRLVPGFEAPTNLAYSARNRSAAIRVPMYDNSPAAKRIEFRPPDASGNPYLAFAAMLMAGVDGIKNRTDPGEPANGDIYKKQRRHPSGARLAGGIAGGTGNGSRVFARRRRVRRIPD